MTAHVHGSTSQGGAATDAAPPGRTPATLTRPWWLLPGVVGALLVGGLVVAGIVSLSTVLYLGLFGGMMLMCMGGHGHGGQGHGAHGSAPDENESLSQRSSGAQPGGSGSAAGLDRRAPHDPTTSETERHDQHSSPGCH
jgi:hypothetical protein